MKWVWLALAALVIAAAIACVLVFVVFNDGEGPKTTTADVTTTAAQGSTTTSPAPRTTTSTTQAPTTTTALRPVVVRIKAPEAVVQLWQGWSGQYVLYAHAGAGIAEFLDLDERTMLTALINTDTIIDDAMTWIDAGGLHMSVGIQNVVDTYKEQFLADESLLAMMVPDVADYCGFPEDRTLVRIEFE